MTPVDRSKDAKRFRYFAPEPRAVMPPGYSGELRIVSTRQLIREREDRLRLSSTFLA